MVAQLICTLCYQSQLIHLFTIGTHLSLLEKQGM